MEEVVFINGILSLLSVLIATILGLIIISRYLKYNNPQLIEFGLFWILVFSVMWSSVIAFLLLLFTNHGLSISIYFIITTSPSAIALIIWIALFTKLKSMKLRNFIIGIYILIGIFIVIYVIYFSIMDPSIIGTVDGTDGSTRGFLRIFSIFAIISYLITIPLFGIELHKSSDPEIKLKGKFLVIAILLYLTGIIMDVVLPSALVIVIIARILCIISAFLFYIGNILPNFIKKMFIKI